jgi:hypothetical protein
MQPQLESLTATQLFSDPAGVAGVSSADLALVAVASLIALESVDGEALVGSDGGAAAVAWQTGDQSQSKIIASIVRTSFASFSFSSFCSTR